MLRQEEIGDLRCLPERAGRVIGAQQNESDGAPFCPDNQRRVSAAERKEPLEKLVPDLFFRKCRETCFDIVIKDIENVLPVVQGKIGELVVHWKSISVDSYAARWPGSVLRVRCYAKFTFPAVVPFRASVRQAEHFRELALMGKIPVLAYWLLPRLLI